jgi:hypothetical protein
MEVDAPGRPADSAGSPGKRGRSPAGINNTRDFHQYYILYVLYYIKYYIK